MEFYLGTSQPIFQHPGGCFVRLPGEALKIFKALSAGEGFSPEALAKVQDRPLGGVLRHPWSMVVWLVYVGLYFEDLWVGV